MRSFTNRYMQIIYLLALFAGTLFFIPAIFVDRFTTAPSVWMQVWIGVGILGYFILKKGRIPFPPRSFIILTAIWAIYHIWQNHGNIENIVTIITLIGAFFLFYEICPLLNDKKLLIWQCSGKLISRNPVLGYGANGFTANSQQSVTLRNGYLPKGIAILFSLGLLSVTAYQGFYEYEWHRIAHKSLGGQTVQMLPRYKKFHTHLRYKDLFLYNYAAELNVAGDYEKSLQIARECDLLWADYDLQMLMAENCLQLQDYKETENCLMAAAAMCPIKFMPLYQLTELYLKTGQKLEARRLAQKILDKKVKIPSLIINSIKIKMRNLLNEPDSLDDSSQMIIHDFNPITTLQWQDCPLDLRTPKALLPT